MATGGNGDMGATEPEPSFVALLPTRATSPRIARPTGIATGTTNNATRRPTRRRRRARRTCPGIASRADRVSAGDGRAGYLRIRAETWRELEIRAARPALWHILQASDTHAARLANAALARQGRLWPQLPSFRTWRLADLVALLLELGVQGQQVDESGVTGGNSGASSPLKGSRQASIPSS
jgi:hypothetical protein